MYFFHGDPLITADVVVVGADGANGNVHAFDRSTGKQRWKYAAGRGVSAAISGLGRHAYAASLEGQLLCFDVDSGALRWTFPLKLPGWEGPATAADRVFAGAADGSLSALNAETGREEWRVNIGVPITTSVSASATDLYVGAADGAVYRVESRSGAVLSSRKLDVNLKPRGSLVRTGDSLLVLLIDEAAKYRALVSVDRALDRVHWRLNASNSWSTSRVFLWGDMVVLGTPSGEVVAYCRDDGVKAWSCTVSGTIRVIGGSEDTLYVGTTEGTLSAVRFPGRWRPR